LHYNEGDATADETAEQLQRVHLSWRGDVLGRKILDSLVQLYQTGNHYDDMLRTWRTILDEYPNDPDTLTINADMGDLFQNLYLHGLADSLPPLESLSLFYEFRDLTPVGQTGDEIIRRLADRLAAFDLLDRATQLLENQIKFRVTDEERSRVGARLALLHLLNHQPKEAADVLQITSYGSNPPELARQRLQLAAEALNDLGKHEEALSMLTNDASREGALLRLDILWSMQDWPNVVSRAEDILSARHNLTAPLTPEETEVLLKLAIGYSFQGDNTQLRYLRDYYMGLIPDTAYKQIFDFITNDTAPLDPADVALLTQQISHTESFLSAFKAKIAAGKLSEAVK
jgi:tetratricopeptide (TPR) repeat protein